MIFTLEALQAKHGDALLLHYGKSNDPKLIVIDGGPSGVYQAVLRPRLVEIKKERSPHEPLPIRMLMVSHDDQDHLSGLVAMTNEMIDRSDSGSALPYDVLTLWHNSFDDIMKGGGEDLLASLKTAIKPLTAGGSLPTNLALSREAAGVMASVPLQRELKSNAAKLGIDRNSPFDDLVVTSKGEKKTVNLGDGLKFNVIGPNKDSFERLTRDWDNKKRMLLKDPEGLATVAAFVDVSVPDISSIVVLAEAGGKKILLTGDARGDEIITGLEGGGFLKNNGTVHVDIFKLPSHGSDLRVGIDLFERVTADHYVVSADGKHGNPAIGTIQMISEARDQDEFIIEFTNHDRKLEEFMKRERKKGKRCDFVFRADDEPSVRIDLGDSIL